MFTIKLASENAIIIYFDDDVTPLLSKKIASIMAELDSKLGHLLIDNVPSYSSLLLTYRIDLIAYHDFCEKVTAILNGQQGEMVLADELVIIPVYYSQQTGLDLSRLLNEKQLDLASLIALHTQPTYSVYGIGFSPAFAFLGHVEPILETPRLKTPRLNIPAGSVGIADNQTAVYPIESAGGWNIIGRTPLDLSLNNPDSLTRFSVGKRVKFEAISKQDYIDMGGQL